MNDQNTLVPALADNLRRIQDDCGKTNDLNIRQAVLGGVETALVTCGGMVNQQQLSELLLDPLMEKLEHQILTTQELFHYLDDESFSAVELQKVQKLSEFYRLLFSGFALVLVEGIPTALAFGFTGFPVRSIAPPENEVNELCAKEGFVESLKVNQTMIRRRIKSPDLQMGLIQVGEISKTDVALVYLKEAVSQKLLQQLRRDLKKIKMPVILSSGYLRPFLQGWPQSLITPAGLTERPDSLCGKICEGRCGILIDGTPFAIIAPYLFTEHFQSMDDYAHTPYYAFLIRCIKYLSFFLAVFLPGMYVALGSFHPELFPPALVFNLASAQESTPYPPVVETLLMHFIYEIMREAGLRLPRAVGHAVSIVGSVVISTAAVSAGLVGAPMVLIITLTAISSFVVPSLREPMSILRILMIVLGGMLGLYGILLAAALLGVNICAVTAYGMPYTAPLAPFTGEAMRDTLVRVGFPRMQRRWTLLSQLKGSTMNPPEDRP